jgi:hypothetical protein
MKTNSKEYKEHLIELVYNVMDWEYAKGKGAVLFEEIYKLLNILRQKDKYIAKLKREIALGDEIIAELRDDRDYWSERCTDLELDYDRNDWIDWSEED